MSDGIQEEIPIEAPLLQEESSWEVTSDRSFLSSESDESSDEESGDEVLRHRHRKQPTLSQPGLGNVSHSSDNDHGNPDMVSFGTVGLTAT